MPEELQPGSVDPAVEDAPKKTRKPREKKPPKPKKAKPARDLKSVFRAKLKEITVDKIKKPWMAEKSFRLIDSAAALEAWVDGVLADRSRHREWAGELCPVVAVDTETISLDTRIIVNIVECQDSDGSTTWVPVYEANTEIAGVCLSADGIEGVYVPIFHERGNNVPRAQASRILQKLFDRSHLVFYNAKFDREVIRISLGINLRGYPHFEDVQVLKYINDPKADLGDKGMYSGDAGGLKALSKNVLGIEQIELSELAKVRAYKWNQETQKNSLCDQYAPFIWVPTHLALWYAAGDAICTWLLWDRMHALARSRKLVHHIDHELVESLTYVERQRFKIDVARQRRTARWHGKITESLSTRLRELAVAAGWPDDPEKAFNPGSPKQLGELLFKKMGFKPYRTTDAGAVSTDKETLTELLKEHPDNEFLNTLTKFRDYAALHPENLKFDHRDNSARMYLKQNVVGGGRLSGAGGEFAQDGGFELNPQGVKKIEEDEMWRVYGNVLDPDEIPADQIEPHDEADLHPSCFRKGEDGTRKLAPGVVNNHIGQYQGYAICLVPSCTSCAGKFGVLIRDTSMDAKENVNLRCLFVAEAGWTFFTIDYSNIEVRAAANLSGEPELQKIFLEGDGDHHALTASKAFPGYNDPNSPDYKAKSLRALAKIINFALQYGGTEWTIYENMSKRDPTITRERAKEMVDNYWRGVPKFAEWCSAKRARARNELVCETATGRVINFESAMKAKRIFKPEAEARKNLGKYYDLRRKAKAEGDDDLAYRYAEAADKLWKNPDTGVRNAIEYNKFLGKIERVSVNAPVQGICGDFMRIALNRIRLWVMGDPDVQKVFRLHGSVHDEIDISIKNEYVPFVLPRLTRLMKLRKYHKQMKWPVPVECDAEYGRSWDIDYNVTDKKHPEAYTRIAGLEKYVPCDFDVPTVKNLYKALISGEDRRAVRAKEWLQASLHPRAFDAASPLFKETDAAEAKRLLIAVLQLHEYWTIDHTPDSDKEKNWDAELETLAGYEQRQGLDPTKSRGFAPSFGFLGAIPLDANVKRPVLDLLGDDPPEPEPEGATPEQQELPLESPETALELESLVYVLKDGITPGSPEAAKLQETLGKGGPHTVRFKLDGEIFETKGRIINYIPEEFITGTIHAA